MTKCLKLISFLLIVAILCTACHVPDISEFTTQSAEMTRGIRRGVTDTESVTKTAIARDDLYSDDTIAALRKDLKKYQEAVKPTGATLDALDAYLEALNALAQANKKSEENSAAVVRSVSNLVSAVSALPLAGSVVNVATGLLTLEEQFRTAKDFKKRVNLASEIVEGRFVARETGADKNATPVLVKACSRKAEELITKRSKEIKSLNDSILERARLSDVEERQLERMSPRERRAELTRLNKLEPRDAKTINDAEMEISSFGCGIIDFIKFNINDLKEINLAVSETMYTNAREKNRVVLGFYENIVASDRRIQNELDRILDYKALIPLINEYALIGADSRIVQTRLTLKDTLNSIFALDSVVAAGVTQSLTNCRSCGDMLKILQTPTDREHCDATCRMNLQSSIQRMTRQEFDNSDNLIEPLLDKKAAELFKQNESYLGELARIKPSYDQVSAELKSMKDKQNQLDSLLDSSLRALDTWAKTHANLKVAVNTKQTLTVSSLAGAVREIWAVVNPGSK